MKSLKVEFSAVEFGGGESITTRVTRVTFRKVHDPFGRHRVLAKMLEWDGSTWVTNYTAVAQVGKRDVGRYDFFAGCRIAFEKLMRSLAENGVPDYGLRLIRRCVQVELSLAQNNDQGEAVMAVLDKLVAQRNTLLKAKYALVGKPQPIPNTHPHKPHFPEPLPALSDEEIEALRQDRQRQEPEPEVKS